MKKIVVKSESCIGCGACVGIDPEHFEFSDDGFSVVKSQDNLESPLLKDAIDACPVAIISLEEKENDVQDETEENNNDKTKEHTCENCSSDCNCHHEEEE